jgi:kynureninase
MNITQFETGEDFAKRMDREDPLRVFRDRFYLPGEDVIYLDGNSLGRLPLKAREQIRQVTDHQWGTRLIRSWNEGWYGRSGELGRKIARIIGAGDGEVIVCDSTSLNLYKLAFAALKVQSGRKKIVSDDLNFPTDLYVLQGIVDQLGPGYKLQIAKSRDGLTMDTKILEEVMDDDTALVVLSHVAFKSAFMYDMKAITGLAHRKGAMMLWDLSHAAGAVPVELNASHADFAIGCTYKYLNGGPGAPAYLYVKKELHDKLTPPVWGWFGDNDPFAFDLQYKPTSGIRKFLVGTPPVLSQEAIGPGLDIILEAGMDSLRNKSMLQTEYMVYLFDSQLKDIGFSLGSPRDAEQRGSHISLRHQEGYRICKALIEPRDATVKVIPDFRKPDNIRIGITPLYTSFEDIWRFVDRIQEIVRGKEYELYTDEVEAVT